jgi:transcription initiation factor TFIIE subunit alpha
MRKRKSRKTKNLVTKKSRQKAKKKRIDDPALKEIIMRVAGKNGYQVAEILLNKGELTDDVLAEKTSIRLNFVRRILYDLYENKVVNYRRARDEKSGWFIYYWHLEPEQAHEFMKNNKQILLQKLQDRLDQEKGVMFFECGNGCPKVPFDQAMENEFKCPQCGQQLDQFDNSRMIEMLEHQIHGLKQQLGVNS